MDNSISLFQHRQASPRKPGGQFDEAPKLGHEATAPEPRGLQPGKRCPARGSHEYHCKATNYMITRKTNSPRLKLKDHSCNH